MTSFILMQSSRWKPETRKYWKVRENRSRLRSIDRLWRRPFESSVASGRGQSANRRCGHLLINDLSLAGVTNLMSLWRSIREYFHHHGLVHLFVVGLLIMLSQQKVRSNRFTLIFVTSGILRISDLSLHELGEPYTLSKYHLIHVILYLFLFLGAVCFLMHTI